MCFRVTLTHPKKPRVPPRDRLPSSPPPRVSRRPVGVGTYVPVVVLLRRIPGGTLSPSTPEGELSCFFSDSREVVP